MLLLDEYFGAYFDILCPYVYKQVESEKLSKEDTQIRAYCNTGLNLSIKTDWHIQQQKQKKKKKEKRVD